MCVYVFTVRIKCIVWCLLHCLAFYASGCLKHTIIKTNCTKPNTHTHTHSSIELLRIRRYKYPKGSGGGRFILFIFRCEAKRSNKFSSRYGPRNFNSSINDYNIRSLSRFFECIIFAFGHLLFSNAFSTSDCPCPCYSVLLILLLKRSNAGNFTVNVSPTLWSLQPLR